MCGSACSAGQTCTNGTCGGSTGMCSTVGGGNCPSSLGACPISGQSCGCYRFSGLGNAKKALLDAGASQYMIASAMMETENMGTNYPLGDNKTGDSFNAGTCKQNWGMIRMCHPAWNGMTASQYSTSTAMNSDRRLDVTVYDECRAMYGDRWWAGHRNGSSGLNNPNTQDIRNFKAAMDWTYDKLSSGNHFCDDIRFWANVPAIIR
jgi:hypothetical protein